LLDIGGVVLVDPLKAIFSELAEVSSMTRAEITDFYSASLREGLWAGRLLEETFWRELLEFARVEVEVDVWRRRLIDEMRPLDAADRLRELASTFRLGALSNHRGEWLRPVLAANGLGGWFEAILISSETGFVKPEAGAFSHAADILGLEAQEITYVDDKEGNLAAAALSGMEPLLADSDGRWLERLLGAP
jgi:putative hydrolase of the HAD superfamily